MKSFFETLKPYYFFIKILLFFVFFVCVYVYAYNQGKNKVLLDAYKKQNKELSQTIDEASKRIKDFNIDQKQDFEKAITESEKRQREFIIHQNRKDFLDSKTRAADSVYVKCKADKEVVDEINKQLRGK